MKLYGWLALLALTLAAQSAHGTLYRWVDENGRTQYSDKPPVSAAPKGVSTLDSQGMVRKSPPQPETPEETARRVKAQQDQLDQQRRDRALLQSFSNTKEIDLLRDRQIDAVNGAIQTNQSRRQGAQAKIDKLNKQIGSFNHAKKTPPDDMTAELVAAQKELADIDVDDQKKMNDIAAIRQRAEADKKRFLELQSAAH